MLETLFLIAYRILAAKMFIVDLLSNQRLSSLI